MPANRPRGARRAAPARVLLAAPLALWGLLLLGLLPGATHALAQPQTGSARLADPPTGSPGPPPTDTPVADTPTTAPATPTKAPPPPTRVPQAPTPVTTRIDLSQPTIGTSSGGQASDFSPSNLTSNGLTIFTTLGCILGLVGLLAITITWITLVSDGWGPMLKAVALGNRRGKLRFERKKASASPGARTRAGQRDPVSVSPSRDRWR